MKPFYSMGLLLLLSIIAILSPVCASFSAVKNFAPALTTSIVTTSIVATSVDTTPTGLAYLDSGAVLHPDTDPDALFEHILEQRGFNPALLLHYDVRCDTSNAASFPGPAGSPPYTPYTMLSECRGWWKCNSAGKMVRRPKDPPRAQRNSWQRDQYDICKEKCECDIIDQPTMHYAENFGCVNPQGGWVQGGVGAISRGEDVPVDIGDGLVMQAYHGPTRKAKD